MTTPDVQSWQQALDLSTVWNLRQITVEESLCVGKNVLHCTVSFWQHGSCFIQFMKLYLTVGRYCP